MKNQIIELLAVDSLAFPPLENAIKDPNVLLAFGGDLSVARLESAYRSGIFPWYSDGEPIMWWSLYVLKTTGCGLPAGPFGLIGAAEGISYLVVIGFVAASILNKVTSGSGLPAGPGGLLGAAEGLSFLTAALGLVVLFFQLTNFGYLPEAVPTVGGICSNI